MKRLSSAALVASLFLASAAHAQEWRNRQERAQDRRELSQDRREVRDDKRDLAELEAVLARFDKAWRQRNEREMQAVEGWLQNLVRRELAEGHVELAKDQAEARQSTREAHASRWESSRGPRYRRPAGYADDRRDLRDDRRDRRDDVRDARQEAASQSARVRIAREMHYLLGSRRPADLQRTRGLILELIQLGRKELRDGQKELREDRRELREDRRETREDRRRRF